MIQGLLWNELDTNECQTTPRNAKEFKRMNRHCQGSAKGTPRKGQGNSKGMQRKIVKKRQENAEGKLKNIKEQKRCSCHVTTNRSRKNEW